MSGIKSAFETSTLPLCSNTRGHKIRHPEYIEKRSQTYGVVYLT